MSELENHLQRQQTELLARIKQRFGDDPAKWNWVINAYMKCRSDRLSGFVGNEVKADLQLGKKTCPISGRVCSNQRVPGPQDNIAGSILAENFPDKCPVCNLTPTWADFDIE